MNLLLLEPDIRLVKALSARLGAGAVVLDAARREEAEALARAGRLDAVFGEAAHLGELAAFASEGIPAGLWTSRSVDDLVPDAAAAGISVVAAKTHPLLFDELAMAADNWARGLAAGSAKFLGPDGIRLGGIEVAAPSEVGAACRGIMAGLPGGLGSSRRLRLVLDELITNSLHHGGSPARVEWGCDAVRHVFLVRDEAGGLVPAEALRLLDRHIHGEGLQDSRGRGLHLSRIYADRLYISVVPGRMTESAAVFWNRPGAYQGYKPIWIQSIGRTRED